LRVGVGLAGEVERLPAVHVRHHLGQVSHVDQRAADIAIAEVLDLGPLGALAADAGASFQTSELGHSER
jgi:hypothetical protein